MSRRTLIALGMTSTYSLATILLVALRLTGIIEWGWLWVFVPLWLPLAIMAFTFGVLALRERVE